MAHRGERAGEFAQPVGCGAGLLAGEERGLGVVCGREGGEVDLDVSGDALGVSCVGCEKGRGGIP